MTEEVEPGGRRVGARLLESRGPWRLVPHALVRAAPESALVAARMEASRRVVGTLPTEGVCTVHALARRQQQPVAAVLAALAELLAEGVVQVRAPLRGQDAGLGELLEGVTTAAPPLELPADAASAKVVFLGPGAGVLVGGLAELCAQAPQPDTDATSSGLPCRPHRALAGATASAQVWLRARRGVVHLLAHEALPAVGWSWAEIESWQQSRRAAAGAVITTTPQVRPGALVAAVQACREAGLRCVVAGPDADALLSAAQRVGVPAVVAPVPDAVEVIPSALRLIGADARAGTAPSEQSVFTRVGGEAR